MSKALSVGDSVSLSTGGQAMTITAIEGEKVTCRWTDGDGRTQQQSYPTEAFDEPDADGDEVTDSPSFE